MIKELSKINVWEQYKRNDGLVSYFDFLRNYLNDNYKDLFYKSIKNADGQIIKLERGKLLKEWTINEAESDYLAFYLKNIYNMMRPHYLVDRLNWDSRLKYDSYFLYDEGGTAEIVPIYLLKKIFIWIYNVKYKVWNIPNLAGMISDFIEEPLQKIKIYKKEGSLLNQKIYTVEMPLNRYSNDFRIVYNTYRNIFNMPIGFILDLYILGQTEREKQFRTEEGDKNNEGK